MKFIPSLLTLQNKQVFGGLSPSYTNPASGEVVFTTGMTGYVETLTDPSYAGQIITFTYPLIGNYGVPASKQWESKKIHARGVIVHEACAGWSHRSGRIGLVDWLQKQNVPIITGVDTRALTKILREHGTMLGNIQKSKPTLPINTFDDPSHLNLLGQVSVNKKQIYPGGKKKLIVVDCGMKENIIRCLQQYPWSIHRVPYTYDYTKETYDAVFVSNGPGDPTTATDTIGILKKAMKAKKPIFGICLGSQLMALAAGAKTYKLPYGHRGQNQPCIDTETGTCVMTSQNHGYAVTERSLPKDWHVTFRNLNDGSVEGVAHRRLPFFSVQFHPEATPGPTDTQQLFQQFFDMV